MLQIFYWNASYRMAIYPEKNNNNSKTLDDNGKKKEKCDSVTGSNQLRATNQRKKVSLTHHGSHSVKSFSTNTKYSNTINR